MFLREKKLRPYFLIIGAQKAGTTALFEYLSLHPDINPPLVKEINYFWQNHLYKKGKLWYLDHFPRTPYFNSFKRKHTFEATPAYLQSPKAAKRIYQFDPKIKFIVLLRNPIQRAYSQFNMYQQKRAFPQKLEASAIKYEEPVKSFFLKLRNPDYFNIFEEAIEMELLQMNQINCEFTPGLISQGLYAQQLEYYFKLFDKNNFLILESKELLNNTQESLQKIIAFLKLRNFIWPQSLIHQHNVIPYKDEMSPAVFDKLSVFFDGPNNQLYKLLGQKFDW